MVALRLLASAVPGAAAAQDPGLRLDSGRFTVVAERQDERLARALLAAAQRNDSFPGLPRPRERVLIAIAPDARRLRDWVGPYAPEWGAAFAFPDQRKIVMQGRGAGSDAGDPVGGMEASWSYAMAHRVVSELDALGGAGGLANFFRYWKSTGSFEKGVRQAYGMTGEGFEKHWRDATRRRYGALSFVTNVSAAVGLFAVVLVPLFLQRRARDRKKLEAMRAADAAQEAAARASALQAILDGAGTADPDDALPAPAVPQYSPPYDHDR